MFRDVTQIFCLLHCSTQIFQLSLSLFVSLMPSSSICAFTVGGVTILS